MPKNTFQPNIRRRKRVMGFLSRMKKHGGRMTIKRRRQKGRWKLSA
ncbi:MAG: 50S ribosomal protein L34 [Elusimicrobia bacterium]|nr:50S ribosomal protein L34 [Elusimicrobiota bacterium]